MIGFILKLLRPKDPSAVDRREVRRYIRIHRQFDRVYKTGSRLKARELYCELLDIRDRVNAETERAIDVAMEHYSARSRRT